MIYHGCAFDALQKLVQEKLKQTDISFSEKLSALKTSMDAIVKEVSVNSEFYSNILLYRLITGRLNL